MNWGKWIVVSFILFAIFIGTLVFVCVREDISLVANDYYKQELDFQKQIERDKNTLALSVKPDISVVNSSVLIAYKELSNLQQGELKLFKPSNAASDLIFAIKSTADTVLIFDLHDHEKGMYKAQFKWSMNNREYYLEKTIYL
ncbi:MAG TPA: FixH family protein [Cyclobacteriaceae bacterium]|nr:FixH family protein [Cyclobacteriaceae bacterium]